MIQKNIKNNMQPNNNVSTTELLDWKNKPMREGNRKKSSGKLIKGK